MESIELTVRTGNHPQVADLTGDVARFAQGRGDGLVSVFVPHATAGVAIIETGAGSDRDLLAAIDGLLPAADGRWRHDHGSPGHGRDHVLPAFISPSITIPVIDGRLALGTWQSVVLVDTNVDNHTRRVRLSFIVG
jgi:secondary thiamine-phosphate synthase enzyme